MIDGEANWEAARRKLAAIEMAMKDGTFDQPVERVGWQVLRMLVEETPKGWTGITRRSWQMQKPEPGSRLVFNSTEGRPDRPNKVMLWLEKGTGNANTPTSRGGYIYPKSKRFLFIPKTSTASITGWRPGMQFGRDYVLARRVRGITARNIVERTRPKAAEMLKDEIRSFLRKLIK